MADNNQDPRHPRKKREMDPIKLVMERGLNAEMRWVHIVDEDGKVVGKERQMTPAPKGLVLAPIQTMVLAKYIMQMNAILETALADDPEDDEAAEEAEGDA